MCVCVCVCVCMCVCALSDFTYVYISIHTQLEYKEIDASSKQNEIEELRQKVRQMQMDMSGLRTKPVRQVTAHSV